MASRTAAVFLIGLGTLVGLVGCSSDGPPPFEGPPVRCLCTTTMIADAVTRVGGDRVEVETLMGPGVDPHTYTAKGGDTARLRKAHIVFFNGLHLEGKLGDILDSSNKRIRGVAVTRTIDRGDLRPAEEGSEAEYDPHVWFNVRLWSKCVECIRDELTTLDPGGADTYRRNAEAYLKELAALDQEIKAKIATLRPERRILVTSHDAFGYFGREYQFTVRGLQGVSTASEAGTRDVQDLADFITTNRVPAVFTETSVPSGGLKAVLTSVTSHTVRVIGDDQALYSDSLGPPGTPGETYPGMIRHNVNTIVAALAAGQ